jgi:hypothetical protein
MSRVTIEHCSERATACHERAMRERDPALRRLMLDLEEHWRSLAQSIQSTESASDFSKEVRRHHGKQQDG